MQNVRGSLSDAPSKPFEGGITGRNFTVQLQLFQFLEDDTDIRTFGDPPRQNVVASEQRLRDRRLVTKLMKFVEKMYVIAELPVTRGAIRTVEFELNGKGLTRH